MIKCVDVLLPAYNAGKTIEKCVESIVGQVMLNKIIIVNDGSTDDTLCKLKVLQTENPQIEIIDLVKNVGLVEALNAGINASKAPYIARMDADDIMLPNRLLAQYEFLVSKDLDMVGASITGMTSKKVYKIYSGKKKEISKLDLFFSSALFHPTWFGKRKVFNLSYNLFSPVEDVDFLYRAVIAGFRIRNLEIPLVEYNESHFSKISIADKGSHIALAFLLRFEYTFWGRRLISDKRRLRMKHFLNKHSYMAYFFRLLELARIFCLKLFINR